MFTRIFEISNQSISFLFPNPFRDTCDTYIKCIKYLKICFKIKKIFYFNIP